MKNIFLIVSVAYVMLMLTWIGISMDKEASPEVELAKFQGILYDISYQQYSDMFLLIFVDGRIFKIKTQPNEGWVIGGLYEITVTPKGVKVELIEVLRKAPRGNDEKYKEDKENLNPGKAF